MPLTLEYLNSTNPTSINDVCDKIRDYFLSHTKTPPQGMMFEFCRNIYTQNGTVWDVKLTFRVNDNSEAVADEYAALLSGIENVYTSTELLHYYRLINQLHRRLTTEDPKIEYPAFKPVLTVAHYVCIPVDALVVDTNKHPFEEILYKWEPDELLFGQHMKCMLKLWKQFKPEDKKIMY